MLENGSEICSCKKKKCIRFGNCKECLEFHKSSERYPVPYCKRSKAGVFKKLLGKTK